MEINIRNRDERMVVILLRWVEKVRLTWWKIISKDIELMMLIRWNVDQNDSCRMSMMVILVDSVICV